MRPISNLAHAFAGTAIAALAATGAAAGKEPHYYTIQLTNSTIAQTGGSAGKGGQIEVHSFHWGPRQSTSAIELEPVKITSYQLGGSGASAGGGANEIRMDDTAGRKKLQPGGGGGGAGQKDMVLKGRNIGQNAAIGQAIGSRAAEGNEDTAQATGKRQHKPFVMRGYYDTSTPPPRGSLTVLASGGSCRVGARYPSLQLTGGGKTYVLQGVTVTTCGGSSAGAGDGLPSEEISFAYQAIKFTY